VYKSNQIFSETSGSISALIGYIDNGDLALPELQRPFVWGNNRVRDLFDSMYRGYPIGYFLIWKNGTGVKMIHIGADEKIHKIPNMLLIDGQQRLTTIRIILSYIVKRHLRRSLEEAYAKKEFTIKYTYIKLNYGLNKIKEVLSYDLNIVKLQ